MKIPLRPPSPSSRLAASALAVVALVVMAPSPCPAQDDLTPELHEPMTPGETPVLSRHGSSDHKAILYHEWHPATKVVREAEEDGLGPEGPDGPVVPEAAGQSHRVEELPPVGVVPGELWNRPLREVHDVLSSPGASVVRTPPIQGVDPMIAVGEEYYLVSQEQEVGFYDRSGALLEDGTGAGLLVDLDDFFRAFVLPVRSDGTPNDDNINLYLDFPPREAGLCDVDNPFQGDFCITDFYDARILWDPFHDRFVILAQARHSNKDINSKHPTYSHLSRRFIAVAVSQSPDPRDGFHQYVVTESNGRDFPWVTVNGDSLISAHEGTETTTGPVATVFHLPAMMKGARTVPRFAYYPKHVGGESVTLLPAMHYPGAGDLTWMIRRGKAAERVIFAFRTPDDPSVAPPLLETSVQMTPGLGMILDNLTYRHGRLHFTTMRNLGGGVMAVHAVRIPVWPTPDGIAASDDPADGFYDGLVQLDADPSLEHRVLREMPASAVNFAGDWLIAYGRWSTEGKPAILPEARYAVWYHGEEFPRWSELLRAGAGQPMKEGQPVTFQAGLDYATAVVDGSDGVSFWIAHEYGTATDHRLVIGKVTP